MRRLEDEMGIVPSTANIVVHRGVEAALSIKYFGKEGTSERIPPRHKVYLCVYTCIYPTPKNSENALPAPPRHREC